MPNYDTKLPANADPEQSAFLLAFINYVEGERPAWMKDPPGKDGEKGTGDDIPMIFFDTMLGSTGVCEVKPFRWWGRWYERPTIYIRRERADTAGSPIDETCVLAHEFGHYRSYQKIGFAAHHRILKWRLKAEKKVGGYKSLLRTRRRKVWAEEVEAWAVGREVLAGNGFTLWADFERVKETSLKTYRDGLGMCGETGRNVFWVRKYSRRCGDCGHRWAIARSRDPYQLEKCPNCVPVRLVTPPE